MSDNINQDDMLRVGTILHGTYRIDGYLSSGGFGNTYVATNLTFGDKVAIKEFFMSGINQREADGKTVSVSNPQANATFVSQRTKFKKEAGHLHQLSNEHIVKVYDLFEENGTAYYVMDFIEGESLAQRLKRTGKPITESEVLEILTHILDALDAAHNARILHLDLKPANIMINRQGVVKLIDFGASKQQRLDGNGATTTTSTIAYTPGFAPSEQLQGALEKFGPWTDFYALGATLYMLLTNGNPPSLSDMEDNRSNAFHYSQSISIKTQRLIGWLMHPQRNSRPHQVKDITSFLSTGKVQKGSDDFANRLARFVVLTGLFCIAIVWILSLYYIGYEKDSWIFAFIVGGVVSLLLLFGIFVVKEDFVDVFKYSPILGVRKLFITIFTAIPTAIVGLWLFPFYEESPVLFAGLKRNPFLLVCVIGLSLLISSAISKWLFNDKDHSTFMSFDTNWQDLTSNEFMKWMDS